MRAFEGTAKQFFDRHPEGVTVDDVTTLLEQTFGALTDVERSQILAGQANPADYLVIPATASITQVDRGTLKLGESVVDAWAITMHVVLPAAAFRESRVLQANGQPDTPFKGMLTQVRTRLVIPKARLTPQGRRALGVDEDVTV